MNDTQSNDSEITNQEDTSQSNNTNIQTVEIQEYNNHVLAHLTNIENANVVNSFFLGAILGSILISGFFRKINP